MSGEADLPLVLPISPADPAGLFACIQGGRGAFLLQSGGSRAGTAGGRARYSYLGVEPFAWAEAVGAQATLDGVPRPEGPFGLLQGELQRFAAPARPGLPPFQGGAVGFLGYELGGLLETLPPPRQRGIALPDLAFGFYDAIVAIDHWLDAAWIISSGLPETEPRRRRRRAQARAEQLALRLACGLDFPGDPGGALLDDAGWHGELGRQRHVEAVRRALDYIRAGDIYQVNVTQRFLGRLRPDTPAWTVWQRICGAAAPFSAFLDLGGGRAIASASPERFLSLDAAGHVETRPIKGTRPRGHTAEADAQLRWELSASAKDRAENLMIVDLLRNDLSRVSVPGSVRVPSLCEVESFSTVHHLVSSIQAQLAPGRDAVDLLRAAFPGGSVTGAPKIRAMQIIHELEPARRGPYCGAIAWLGWDGAMDSSIVIRTVAMAGREVVVQAGGGIVADSDPAAEYEETLLKARPLLTALAPDMAWPPADDD